MSDLIIVKQLPIIEERLKMVADEIDKELERATSLACTEDTVKEVKKTRAELNKKYEALEQERKAVKKAVNEPYKQFEAVYAEYVGDKFKKADNILKSKIYGLEDTLKADKREQLREFFTEYALGLHLDFVKLPDTGVNVTLSASLTSLKKTVAAFLDKVAEEVAAIETQEDGAEILVEYKKDYDMARAIHAVTTRKQEIEQERQRAAEQAQAAEAEAQAVGKVEEAVASTPTLEPPAEVEPEYRMTFTVIGTKAQLKAVKNFLKNGGFKYE